MLSSHEPTGPAIYWSARTRTVKPAIKAQKGIAASTACAMSASNIEKLEKEVIAREGQLPSHIANCSDDSERGVYLNRLVKSLRTQKRRAPIVQSASAIVAGDSTERKQVCLKPLVKSLQMQERIPATVQPASVTATEEGTKEKEVSQDIRSLRTRKRRPASVQFASMTTDEAGTKEQLSPPHEPEQNIQTELAPTPLTSTLEPVVEDEATTVGEKLADVEEQTGEQSEAAVATAPHLGPIIKGEATTVGDKLADVREETGEENQAGSAARQPLVPVVKDEATTVGDELATKQQEAAEQKESGAAAAPQLEQTASRDATTVAESTRSSLDIDNGEAATSQTPSESMGRLANAELPPPKENETILADNDMEDAPAADEQAMGTQHSIGGDEQQQQQQQPTSHGDVEITDAPAAASLPPPENDAMDYATTAADASNGGQQGVGEQLSQTTNDDDTADDPMDSQPSAEDLKDDTMDDAPTVPAWPASFNPFNGERAQTSAGTTGLQTDQYGLKWPSLPGLGYQGTKQATTPDKPLGSLEEILGEMPEGSETIEAFDTPVPQYKFVPAEVFSNEGIGEAKCEKCGSTEYVEQIGKEVLCSDCWWADDSAKTALGAKDDDMEDADGGDDHSDAHSDDEDRFDPRGDAEGGENEQYVGMGKAKAVRATPLYGCGASPQPSNLPTPWTSNALSGHTMFRPSGSSWARPTYPANAQGVSYQPLTLSNLAAAGPDTRIPAGRAQDDSDDESSELSDVPDIIEEPAKPAQQPVTQPTAPPTDELEEELELSSNENEQGLVLSDQQVDRSQVARGDSAPVWANIPASVLNAAAAASAAQPAATAPPAAPQPAALPGPIPSSNGVGSIQNQALQPTTAAPAAGPIVPPSAASKKRRANDEDEDDEVFEESGEDPDEMMDDPPEAAKTAEEPKKISPSKRIGIRDVRKEENSIACGPVPETIAAAVNPWRHRSDSWRSARTCEDCDAVEEHPVNHAGDVWCNYCWNKKHPGETPDGKVCNPADAFGGLDPPPV